METSMRYAMQLIVVGSITARRARRPVVGLEDIKKAHDLFLDVGRSCEVLERSGNAYMFHETAGPSEMMPG